MPVGRQLDRTFPFSCSGAHSRRMKASYATAGAASGHSSRIRRIRERTGSQTSWCVLPGPWPDPDTPQSLPATL